MYGECIALSFCEGCHVSHDRKLVWEMCQNSSGFWPEESYSVRETLVVDCLPQVRCATSMEKVQRRLILGAVRHLSLQQESWLNWGRIEVVK